MTAAMVQKLVGWGVVVVTAPYLMNQVRKPTRWVGRLFAWNMNHTHAGLTDWGLGHVRIEKGFSILDVGCGGGATVRKLATAAPDGRVVGIDYSAGSVEASRATNKQLIAADRVEIREASVSRIPYPDATFDLVTAVETHYYWPDRPADLKEVMRVTRPGGQIAVIAEAYKKGGVSDAIEGTAMMLLRAAYMTADEHRSWFTSAGLADVQVHEQHNWICVTGSRPA
jgi:ubiquinone/menaquinone biosynthesis C-methylase UbiE